MASKVNFSEENVETAIEASSRKVALTLKAKQKEASYIFIFDWKSCICMPTATGYGKSLCFALLPVVFDYLRGQKNSSIVVCVSPLTS